MRKEKIMWLRAGMLGVLVALLVLGVGGELSAQPKAEPLEFKIGIVDCPDWPGIWIWPEGSVRRKVQD